MKIISWHAENIKRVVVVDIEMKGDVLTIEGKNAQGKSSSIDALCYLLGGERLIPHNVVKQGEDKAKIQAVLADPITQEFDGVTITRTWKKGGEQSTLEIKLADGSKVRSPQEWLNEKISLSTFDPMMFCNLRPVERVEELKKIPGLDCSAEDEEYQKAYDRRHLVNRDLDKAKKALTEYEGIETVKGLRKISDIQADIDAVDIKNTEINNHNAEMSKRQFAIEAVRFEYKTNEEKKEKAIKDKEAKIKEIENLQRTIEELKASIVELDTTYTELIEIGNKIKEKGLILKKELEGVEVKTFIDTTTLKEELLRASDNIEVKAKFERKKEIEKEIVELESSVRDIQSEMDAITEKKKAKIASFKLPVLGLEVGSKDIMFSGIPFDNLSQAQKISVSMALAMAQNPSVKVLLVREASLFDKTTLQLVVAQAKEKDFQIIFERVSDSPSSKDVIYIEDGEIQR